MLTPKMAKLFSVVSAALVLPLLGLYGLLIVASSPSENGGIDATSAMVCRFAFTILFAALIVVAVNFSLQLAQEAKGVRQTP